MSVTDSIPPKLPEEEIRALAESLYGVQCEVLRSLGSFIDQNYYLRNANGDEYTLKIHDAAESAAVLQMQTAAARLLATELPNIQFPTANLSLDGKTLETVHSNGQDHAVRLLNYVPGTLFSELLSFSSAILKDTGFTLAHMDTKLEGFAHPGAFRPGLPWDLQNAAAVRPLCECIEDHGLRRLANYFFLQYEVEVKPRLAELRQSIVHDDSHRYSLLTDAVAHKVTGVIDFGDMVHTYTINNLAISLSDLLVQCDDLIGSSCMVVNAYHSVRPLHDAELAVLYYLIGTRLSIYSAMSAKAAKQDPDNTHAQIKRVAAAKLLRAWITINPLHFEDQIRIACDLQTGKNERSKRASAQVEKRKNLFPASLYTHYKEPISLYKGALQYLYSDDGKTYLDCVNNVCQWGHCHPDIVRAGQQQIARLNTNSRYLFEQMTEYAERLLQYFPEELDTCFLVNSGSEANDLALRLAKAHSGNTDVLVIDKAYHGNSSVCTDISPNRIDRAGGPGLPDYVHSVSIPDGYRGKYRSEDQNDIGSSYAQDVASTISDLHRQNKTIAAFYAESLIGTGGQIVLPPGYLKKAYQFVRAAGGLCIADEVQVGFARTANQMWCFESHGVVPDIVTLGKPIGNGHPMAAVITRRDIANSFDNGITYFNTFGGNPVSCATGLAVLDVLEQEQLLANTRVISRDLTERLLVLQSKHPIIGDVRGQGLYIGVELVSDSGTREPATEQTASVVALAKEAGLLLNANGYDNNIIKIKPPLIIDEKDIEQIIDTLDHCLAEVTKAG